MAAGLAGGPPASLPDMVRSDPVWALDGISACGVTPAWASEQQLAELPSSGSPRGAHLCGGPGRRACSTLLAQHKQTARGWAPTPPTSIPRVVGCGGSLGGATLPTTGGTASKDTPRAPPCLLALGQWTAFVGSQTFFHMLHEAPLCGFAPPCMPAHSHSPYLATMWVCSHGVRGLGQTLAQPCS